MSRSRKKRGKNFLKNKIDKEKARRVCSLIEQTQNQRGNGSEEFIVAAIEEFFHGAVQVERTIHDSDDDHHGIDFYITFFCNGNKIRMPLQVKSCEGYGEHFLKISKKKGDAIPVLVREPGATKKEVANVLEKIFLKYNKNQRAQIMEVARFKS